MYNIIINYKSEKEIEYEEKIKDLKEKWKYIKINGIEFNYQISNSGRVRNMKNNKIMKPSLSGKGYVYTTIRYNNESYRFAVHRLVAVHFIKIPKKYSKKGYTYDDLVPNHLDGIRTHNAVFNLEWSTIRDNTIHAFETGLADSSIGERSHLAKMSDKQADIACELLEAGWRVKDIANKLGVTPRSIQHIKDGESWIYKSKNYNFARIGKAIPYTLDDNIIHNICKDLETKQFSDSELSKKYRVSREYIRDIRNHKRRNNISQYYNF